MFLRSKVFVHPSHIQNIAKRLVSNEIREVLNTRLENPAGVNENQLKLAVVSKNLNALNLDLFVHNLGQYDDRRLEVLDLLSNLRTTKLANTILESTQFAVVRHLLDNSSIQEIVPVLIDRPKYGIFLNNFTGFAVIQTLHNEKVYSLALPLALKLVLLDGLDSVFIQLYCIKSCIETLKQKISDESTKEEKTTTPTKGKIIEKKIRVGFLRNPYEPDVNQEMGKAILKIASKIFQGNEKDNSRILGLILTSNYDELTNILNTTSAEINGDIAAICKELLSRENRLDFAQQIEKLENKMVFGEIVDGLMTEAADKEAISLAEKQNQLFSTWQQLREQTKICVENEIREKERIKNIEKIKSEIATKKELLWFFDNEEKHDLDIHNKRVFYPKRWFGKKKKPRVADEHYVPPQVRKID